MIQTKRIYGEPDPDDGYRVLVDRLWPRGVSKSDAALDDWMQAVAPSDELRQWFDHDPERWSAFRRGYRAELDSKTEQIEELCSRARPGTLTLLYAASDREHNNAVLLRDYLEGRLE